MTEEQTPKRMTSLDRKIEASRLRAEAERKSHAVPQSRPTEGMTSLLSTENCNVANQRKPAHGGRVATEGPGPGFNIVLEPGPVFVVGQGPAAETVAEVIEAAAAGTQPSPEQIKAAIQERERTEAQLRATWEPQTRAQRLNRKAFSDGIAAGMNKALEGLSDAAVRGIRNIMPTLSGPDVEVDAPGSPERVTWSPRRQLFRMAIPPAGCRTMAHGPNGLQFHIERSDEAVYLVVDGPGV